MGDRKSLISIIVLIGVVILRLILAFDRSTTTYLIVLAVGFFLWLVAYTVKKESQNALPDPQPKKKRLALIPLEHEGRTYTYVDDMPYEGRKSYYAFISSLRKADPEELKRLLISLGREDVATKLQEAQEMLDAGLLTIEEYLETTDQILTPEE